MSQKDYYKVLGVAESASQDDIKKAYKKLAVKYHPDKHPKNKKEAEDRFKEISEAYYVIGNPEKRSQYDMMRKYGYSTGGGQPGAGGYGGAYGFNVDDFLKQFGGGASRGSRRRSSGEYSMFNDVFADLFGGMGGGSSQQYYAGAQSCGGGSTCGSRSVEQVDTDVEKNISLSQTQAQKGGKIKLNLPDGKVIMVNIPEHARDGQKLKIPREGSVCPCCNKKGDLLLVLRIQ